MNPSIMHICCELTVHEQSNWVQKSKVNASILYFAVKDWLLDSMNSWNLGTETSLHKQDF